MSLVRCPHCKLPLTDDEASVAACPACGGSLKPGAGPRAPAAAAKPDESVAPPGAMRWLWGGAVLSLALTPWALSLVLVPGPGAGRARPARARPAGPAPKGAAPQPSQASGKGEAAPPPARATAGKKAAPRETPAALAPPDESPAEPQPEPVPPPAQLAMNEVRLDRPDGTCTLGALRGGSRMKLTGRVRTLRVGAVDAGSLLDASGLEAREVVFTDRVGGRSTVKLRAPGGTVEFHDRVDGDAQVFVTARAVEFRGVIKGRRTHVLVTLTRGGRLRFREIAGSTRLHYRKAAPGDPEPRVEAGAVTGRAELEKVQ
jgi:hypothetical protein